MKSRKTNTSSGVPAAGISFPSGFNYRVQSLPFSAIVFSSGAQYWFSIVFSTAANSLMQLNSPEEMRGRVMSLHTLFFRGTTPVGGLVTGALAEQWGIQKTQGIQAGFCLIGLTIALAYRQKMKIPPRGVEPGK